MELQEAILKRRSIRKFKEDKVKEEDVNLILQMAMAGPSACNKKPWEFFVITNEEMLNQFANVSKSSSFKHSRIPLPPPPNAALIIIGKPILRATS